MKWQCNTCASARTAHYPRPCNLCAGYAKADVEVAA